MWRSTKPDAARLGIDHSTVFRRLRQIEATLGTAMFERHRSGYVPTAAGEEAVTLAVRVDEDITAVIRRLSGRRPDLTGDIRIATSDVILDLLMPALTRFGTAHPSIRLEFAVGNLPTNLSRRDADLAIRATQSPPETLVGRRAATIAWARYARRTEVGEEDVAAPDDRPWLTVCDHLSRLPAALAVAEQVPHERIAARFDSVAGLARAIEAGLGQGYLPCFVGDRRLALHRMGDPIPAFSSTLWVLTHEDLRHTPRISVLMKHLSDEIADLFVETRTK